MLKLATNKRIEIEVGLDGETASVVAIVRPLKASEKLAFDNAIIPLRAQIAGATAEGGSIDVGALTDEAVMEFKRIWRELGDAVLVDVEGVDCADGLSRADTVRAYAPELLTQIGQAAYAASTVNISPGKSASKSTS